MILLHFSVYFEENGVTHSFMTTQVGRQFAMEMSCESLQYLSIGGEKLVPMEPPKDYKFFNAYGPTECTIFTTVFEVDKYYSNIPIGKALDNFKLYIADKFGHLLPYGACGELMISGWQVSRGYLNNRRKLRKIYTKNIYDDAEGYEVLYHSGDVARYLRMETSRSLEEKTPRLRSEAFELSFPRLRRS